MHEHAHFIPEVSKPNPRSGSPGQGFPEQLQLVSISNGQPFLWPHKEEDRENDLSENESSYKEQGLGVHPPGERAGNA